jgi:hypothetical protein
MVHRATCSETDLRCSERYAPSGVQHFIGCAIRGQTCGEGDGDVAECCCT